MYELVQVKGNSYYIECPSKIGVVRLNDSDVFIIDSGNDKDAAKKVLKILDSHGWKLKFIINTHSHADHIGGNKFLQDKTGCKIYAKGIECSFSRSPVLEPSFLFGGFPPSELRKKFFIAQDSKVDYLTDEVLPDGFEIISLDGHFFDMIGIKTTDNVLYIADSLSGKDILDKYKIVFIYDVGKYIDTLEKLKIVQADYYVPSHTTVNNCITDLIKYNIDSVNNVADTICKICNTPKNFEKLLQEIFYAFDLKMSFDQYALVGSTVRSYLSWLKYNGKIMVIIQENMILWKTV